MKHSTCLLLIAFTLFGISCTNDESCTQDRIAKMGVGFYTRALTDTLRKVYTTRAINLDTLSVRGLAANGTLIDSILYKSKAIQKVYLPLNKFETGSKFVLTFKTTTGAEPMLPSPTKCVLMVTPWGWWEWTRHARGHVAGKPLRPARPCWRTPGPGGPACEGG